MTEKECISFEVYSALRRQAHYSDVGFVSNGHAGRTWGRGAAGILVVSASLQDVLLLRRSHQVQDPHFWGISGGARREYRGDLEEALVTAIVESKEEMGSLPRGKIGKQPYIYQKPGTEFTYKTFILEIDSTEREFFVPRLNWEHTDYRWFRRDSLQGIPIHPGVKEVLENYQFEPENE